jgi:putative protein-disulfide isomerase
MSALPVLVVAFDPLCGWCFAFEPTLARLRADFAGRARFDIAMGGLVVGERVRPVREDAAYLRRGLAAVAARTGVQAGEAYFRRILEPGDWISRSEPPCRAIRILRDLAGPEAALDLAAAMTRALYRDGERIDEPAVIGALAAGLGVAPEPLLARWAAPGAEAESERAFAGERARGVGSYPAMFLADARTGGLFSVFAGALAHADARAAVGRAIAAADGPDGALFAS